MFKLWTFEERRNRLDLIKVLMMRNELSKFKLNDLVTLDDNITGI